MSWAELIIASSSIADSIKDSGFWPQVMVAPDSRGGIIAKLISQELQDHNINIPILVGITVWKKSPKFKGDLSAYDFLETKRWGFGLPKVSYANPDQKILIVDDIVHSGDTLELTRRLLLNGGVPSDNIRTAALVVSESAVKNQNSPDFCWKRTHSTEFLFPWGKAR